MLNISKKEVSFNVWCIIRWG